MVVTVANKTHWLAITIFSPKSLKKKNRNITTYLMVKNGYVLSVPLLNIAVKRNFSSRNPVNKLGTLAPQQNSVNVRSCCSCNQRFDWLDNQPRKQPGTSCPDKRLQNVYQGWMAYHFKTALINVYQVAAPLRQRRQTFNCENGEMPARSTAVTAGSRPQDARRLYG